MPWKTASAEDPFSPPPRSPAPPRLAVVERPEPRGPSFISQLGVGWIVVLSLLAVGAVLLAAFVWQPMMALQ